ncbi:MAG: S8 family serine peptidase, partial [Xanthomonadales bacterium]|nr:S8 family serine peptidase [Xanthomonadales bacterium]
MMKKQLLNSGVLLAALCLAGAVAAQSPVALATRQAELRALSAALYQRDLQDRQALQAYARRLGIAVRRELPDGRVLELQRLLPGPLLSQRPVFYITNNIVAADTVSTDEVWPGGSAGLDLDGSGMSVAQWDGGAVFADHPDFAGRLTQVDGAGIVSGHSTHVAGTLVGAGDWLYADSRGMAFAAHLDAYDWISDTAEMAAAAASGELVSNHSYGIAAGWIYMGGSPPDQWWWIGGADPADVEDPNFGYYDAESQLWDQIAYDAPYYLPVKAAGNDRTDIGPAPGEVYTVIDQQGNKLFTSTLPRNYDCAPAGYDCLPGHSVAKNILTVGAVDDLPGGYSALGGPGAVAMADFSSWGPTDDGRIKPDLVGNGMFLFSAWPDSPYYALAAGTSMAAPNITGSLLLLQQHYENINGPGSFMRGATLKALAIHTADETGDAPGPDYEFGWGLLNTRTAARVISEDGGAHQIVEGSLANGGVQSYPVSVAQSGAVLTATLVWADPPGTPVPAALDPPDLMLVNDLDLRISRGANTWFPWVLDPAAPAAAAGKGDNFRDNVEQVEVTGAASGSYTVEVRHKGALLNGSNQDYALIFSVTPPPPVGSGFLIDEDFSGGMPTGWSVVTSQGVSWSIKTPVPGDWRLDNNTGGGGPFAMVDNNYTRVLTALRTPLLDLSVNDAAILRFSSYFLFDFFETINVDVSTDGGSTWSNVWQNQGFNQFAARVVLDLSAAIAGQSNVMLRFRYDSLGDPQGNLWQVDDIELEVFGGGTPPGDPPAPATDPSPANGAAGLGIDDDLSWTAGALAASHDVYFGTSAPLGGGDFQVNQAANAFDPGTLAYATTYYWRVDEVNADGTTQGMTWSFTTESAPVAETIHLAALSGSALPGTRGRWTAAVQVTVADRDGNAEPGVIVSGAWSNGASGSSSCLTGGDGSCIVEKTNLKSNIGSVTFTVTGLDKAGMTYAPADNAGGNGITVSQTAVDLMPGAADDSYQTGVDAPLGGNLMDNDDPGDAPASIESHSLPAHGSLSLAADGAFTYTPHAGFAGDDGFTYRIVDQDGDLSNTATVTITVASAPPPGARTVNATPFKVKGVQHVQLSWQNFSGATVAISRDGAA